MIINNGVLDGVTRLTGHATDVAGLGNQARGVTGRLADAGHVHPGKAFRPSWNGLLLASGDPNTYSSSSAMTAGTVYLIKLVAEQSTLISNLWWLCNSAGSGASSGSYCGLYSPAGLLLTGSADCAAKFTTSGNGQSFPVTTPQVVPAGSFVWAVILSNLATTQPTLMKGATAGNLNVGLTAASIRWAVNGTSQTSLPTSITVASNTTTNAQSWWIGAS